LVALLFAVVAAATAAVEANLAVALPPVLVGPFAALSFLPSLETTDGDLQRQVWMASAAKNVCFYSPYPDDALLRCHLHLQKR
jgi:hypothetical protein